MGLSKGFWSRRRNPKKSWSPQGIDNPGIELEENENTNNEPDKKNSAGRRNGAPIVVGNNGKEEKDASSSVCSQYPEYLNYGEEDEMEIQGYVRSKIKTVFTWLLIVLTGGLLRLIFHWWPRLMLYATHRRSPVSAAEKVLIIEQYQQKYRRYYVKPVYTVSSDMFKIRSDAAKRKKLDPDCTLGISSRISAEESLDRTPMDDKPNGPSETVHRDINHCFLLLAIGRLLGVSSSNKPSSRTNEIFMAAGLPKDQITEEKKAFDRQLEQELENIESPKLAIPRSDGSIRETNSVRLFTCKKLRYLWDDEYGAFVKLQGFDNANAEDLHKYKGLSIFEQCQRRLIYGSNEIKVEVQSIIKLLFLEVLNPFYVFQIFSVILWFSDNYYYFATAIIIMSLCGIVSTVAQTRKNQRKLRTTVQSSDIVIVCRGPNVFESIPTEYLVPGDVIAIPAHGCTMHCDAALLSGNCIVNESMLTGESVPVTKIPLPNRSNIIYNSKEHARHTLFCGTRVIQTRYYGEGRVLAVVLRSGFLTAKGSLVRSIMYPPPVDYKFERDSYKFVAVLAGIAGIGFIFSILMKLRYGESIRNIIVDSLDLITIVVPPALPAAMTVGRYYAQRRLQRKGIYCISPRAINVSGSIDCVCFDKTGTLTEEGLDLWGAIPSQTVIRPMGGGDSETFASFQAPVRDASKLPVNKLYVGMAACHSLTLIDGSLIGDPLDLKMFEWTGWALEEPSVADNEKFDMIAPTVVRPQAETNSNNGKGNMEVGVIRQFPFSSSLQRMSVITRTLGATEFELYCKGSPEMVTSLSRPETVPKNFNTVLERYAQEGFRVIALGYKKLNLSYAKAQRVLRDEVEGDLEFLGLIVLDNRLKPATIGEMATLKKAGIRTIMVTGDNMLTALSVARECGMVEQNGKVFVVHAGVDGIEKGLKPVITFSVANKPSLSGTQSPVSVASRGSTNTMEQSLIDVEAALHRYHFAMTGHAFAAVKNYYPELLPKLLVRGTVFARMSPDQKQQLVEHLQAMGYFVGMCGDGANDCGALKAAHAGISLSEAESSVASPFTSKEPNIKCVPHVIREGRAALVTSFGIFKYMAIYSLTQFVTVFILYTIQSNLSDLQFLYIDLFLISVFALFFGRTEPYDGPLVKRPPSASLVSPAPIASILSHMACVVGIQSLAFFFVQQQSWYTPYDHVEDEYAGFENYTLFGVSAFQYIIMAIVFSQGKPYRKSLWSNYNLLASLVGLTAFTVYMLLTPCSWLVDNFQLKLPPSFEFRVGLLVIGGVNLVISLAIEHGIIDSLIAKKFGEEKSRKQKEHVQLDKELSRLTDWPPLADSFSNANLIPDDNRTGTFRRHSITLTIPVNPNKSNNNNHVRSQSSTVAASEPQGGFQTSPLHSNRQDFDVAIDMASKS